MSRPPFRRRRKLIKPRVQLHLIFTFLGLAALALLLQFLMLGARLTFAVTEVEGPGGELAQEIPRILLQVLGLSLVVCVPVIFAFGVLLTHKIAGPIYRFEQFLGAVARGEQSEPCRIRQGDYLQPLCDVINEAVKPLLVTPAVEGEGADEAGESTGPVESEAA